MSNTKAWQEYEQGVDYKTRIGLYSTVDLNERFFSGDQWVGIPHEGLPTPVVNFIKYASAWKIAAVTDRRLELEFFAEGIDDGGDIGTYAQQISKYCDLLWERLKMDYMTKEGLKQAAITGDYIQYFYWDPDIDTGQAVSGDIATIHVDNVNYYPGNPNDPDVQRQPYIILAFRELVSKVRDEAKSNGCKQIDEIVSDEENEYTSGDRGKIELSDSGKCNVLLKMYKKDGRVYCEKSVKGVVIQEEKDTQLTRYPVALMNWETRKNCCHGTAEVTGLIPNQVFVNKILALSQLGQVQTSFPKVIFDKTRIKQWSNKVAGAIPVNGDIGGAARYMSPPHASSDAWRGLDVTIDQTMRMMGANDVTLGNISNPENTSAFIATRDAAMVPLQSQQELFYAFIEDVGLIWLDFIKNFYKAGRMIPVMQDGQRVFVPLPEDTLDQFAMKLKVDVGPSSMWSEIQVLQTLDNLLARQQITFAQYLERIPDGHIPMKEELLNEIRQAEQGGASQGAPDEDVVQLVQVIQAGAEAGEIDGQIAAGIMSMAEQGAGYEEIAQALGSAAEQGMIPEQVMDKIMQGMGAPPMESAPEQMQAVPDEDVMQLVQVIQAGAQAGEIDGQVAAGIMSMAEQGAGFEEIAQALSSAAEQGMISEQVMDKIMQGMGAPPKQGVPEQTQAVPDDPAPERVMQEGVPEEVQTAPNDMPAQIMQIVDAGVEAGAIEPQIAQSIMAMIEQGLGGDEILQALSLAVEQGAISEQVMETILAAVGQQEQLV